MSMRSLSGDRDESDTSDLRPRPETDGGVTTAPGYALGHVSAK